MHEKNGAHAKIVDSVGAIGAFNLPGCVDGMRRLVCTANGFSWWYIAALVMAFGALFGRSGFFALARGAQYGASRAEGAGAHARAVSGYRPRVYRGDAR